MTEYSPEILAQADAMEAEITPFIADVLLPSIDDRLAERFPNAVDRQGARGVLIQHLIEQYMLAYGPDHARDLVAFILRTVQSVALEQMLKGLGDEAE